MPEGYITSIKLRAWYIGEAELGTVGMRPAFVGHAHHAGVVLESALLLFKKKINSYVCFLLLNNFAPGCSILIILLLEL